MSRVVIVRVRVVPLLAALTMALVPSGCGAPARLVALLGILSYVGVSIVDGLAANLGLGWPAMYLGLTATIAALALGEYAACLGSWQGEAAGLAYGCVEQAFALVALQVATRWLCDAIRDERRIDDEWLDDHDVEERDDDD